MTIQRYRHRPDYTTELRLHDGSVEVITHCGRCLSIIWRKTCVHCDGEEATRQETLKQFLAGKKRGVTN